MNYRFDTSAPLYKHIAYLNQIRNWCLSKSSAYLNWQTGVLSYTSDVIVLRKDIIRIVLTNQGEKGGEYDYGTSGAQFEAGETVVEILTCKTYTAKGDGEVDVKMQGGLPSVLVPGAYLVGSGMCSF